METDNEQIVPIIVMLCLLVAGTAVVLATLVH